MDKLKNAAIYLVKKSEKEDSYFISQKIKRIIENCKRKDIEIIGIFIDFQDKEGQEKYLKEQIKENKIQILIIEESEMISLQEKIEIERVSFYTISVQLELTKM